jgi:P pilus assembly chaperone PapD
MNLLSKDELNLVDKLKLLFYFFIGGCSSQTQGLEVSPLVHEMNTSGRGTSSRIIVRNPSDTAMPLVMEVQRIFFKPDGSYDLSSTEEELFVFPPAVLLGPGSSQAVRLQWMGKSKLTHSRSYFISLSQPDISLPREKANGVRLSLTFNALVHIASLGTKPLLQVQTIKPMHDKSGDVLQANIFNAGQRYGYISDYKLNITVDGKLLVTLKPGELRQRGKDVFFPPGSKRTVLIPLGEARDIWNGPIKLELLPASSSGYL